MPVTVYTKKQRRASRARMLACNSWVWSNSATGRKFQSRRQGVVGGAGRSGGIIQRIASIFGSALLGKRSGGRSS